MFLGEGVEGAVRGRAEEVDVADDRPWRGPRWKLSRPGAVEE